MKDAFRLQVVGKREISCVFVNLKFRKNNLKKSYLNKRQKKNVAIQY